MGRRHSRYTPRVITPPLKKCVRGVVAIANALLVGMRWAHRIAAFVKDTTRQECGRRGSKLGARDGSLSQPRLDGIECLAVENRFVRSRMNLVAINNLADIEPVREDVRKRTDHESLRGNRPTACEASRLR